MNPPTFDLATTEQLIAELMNRPTFVGVVIAVRTDVTGNLSSAR